jgi:hypothetical protein
MLYSNRGLAFLSFQYCPRFECKFIALKSRIFVLKSRTKFAMKFVRDLNAKDTSMGDRERCSLGHSAPEESCDPSLSRISSQLGLSRTLLYKLLQRYRPQTSSLFPWRRGRKPDEPLLSDDREALLSACITECYLQPERPSLAGLQVEVRRAGIVAKFLILVTDCHSQEMCQLGVAEIEANAQLIWGTCCPAFPDQFRWFGLATLVVVDASYGEGRLWRKRTKRGCRC